MRAFSYMLAFALLLISTSAFPADNAPSSLPGRLQRIPHAKVLLAYVKPGTDWSRYRTIKLIPLDIPAKARDTAPKGIMPGFGQRYMMNDREVADLKQSYDQTTREELAKGGYAFVDAPQADTLVVAAQIAKIELNAPIDDTSIGVRGRSYSKGAGSMAIAAVLSDGASGTVIAQVADRRISDDSLWTRNLGTNNRFDAQRAFRGWAAALRERLSSPRATN